MDKGERTSANGAEDARRDLNTYWTSPSLKVFGVTEWPEVDRTYAHVLVRLPGGYEFTLSAGDAQRLGQRLNQVGGGNLAANPAPGTGADQGRGVGGG